MKSTRFAFVYLAPGVNRRHMAAFLAVVVLLNLLAAFVNAAQPGLLSNLLGIPTEAQGRALGALVLAAEIVMIIFVPMFGALSDRIGRRAVMLAGFAASFVSISIFAHAESLTTLVIFRALTAVGFAALVSTALAIMADYAVDESRGKASGWLGFLGGAGGVLAYVVLMGIPKWLSGGQELEQVVDYRSMAHTWFYIVGGLALVSCLVAAALKSRAVETAAKKRQPLLQMTREAISAAKQDPGLGIAYAAAFVARGDMVIVAVYVMLWLTQAGEQAGLRPEEVSARAGQIAALAPVFAVLSAPFVGLLCDRINRVVALALTLGLAGLAYNTMHAVADPFGLLMVITLALLGVAEMGVFVSSQALMAERAPEHIRGSVAGFFSMCGAIGILAATSLGGILFDAWRPSGPFVMFGVLNILLCIAAIALRRRIKPLPAQAAPGEPSSEPLALATQPEATEGQRRSA